MTLAALVESVRARAALRRRTASFERLEDHVKPDSWRRERFLTAVKKPTPTLIAEIARRTIAGETLFAEVDDAKRYGASRRPRIGSRWHALAAALKDGGADALSVVTEESRFDGSLDDLRAVEFTRLPRLRRDFVLDEAMVLESGLYGADALTLVASILDDETLARTRAIAKEYGFAVLVEVRDERELERALPLEPEMIGAGARDPATLAPDRASIARLLPRVPAGPLKVALDVASAEEARTASAAGAECVLVGAALARASDVAAELREWRAALGTSTRGA